MFDVSFSKSVKDFHLFGHIHQHDTTTLGECGVLVIGSGVKIIAISPSITKISSPPG